MVEILSAAVTIVAAITGATWHLSSRLTAQDYWLKSIHRRVSRLERKAGTEGWETDDL